MGLAFDVLNWASTHTKRTVEFLGMMLAIFPFVVIIVLTLLILGLIPSPMLSALQKIEQDHAKFTKHYVQLSASMIQLNSVAEKFYDNQKQHAKESQRMVRIAQYLVLEGCRRDNKNNPSNCDQLERTLEKLEP